jgi:Na+/H+ antiporter NhaD/arsenite permease-like protein
MPDDTLVAAVLFVGAYVLIAAERWDRTLIALLAGLAMVMLGIVDQQQAFAAIDLNVIFLLVGMMIIASILAGPGSSSGSRSGSSSCPTATRSGCC